MSVEAMKQALEAWQTSVYGSESHHKAMLIAMTNMAQAIEQAERQQALDKKAENARELGLSYEPVQDELAYRQAVSLATWLFKKHFAHEEHYASGRVVWEPCDTTAGVISQIDNMVCGLVQPAATVKESLTVQPAAPVQEPVAHRYCCHSCFKASGGVMLDRMIFCPECGNKRCPKASDHSFSCAGSNEPGQIGSIYSVSATVFVQKPATDEEMKRAKPVCADFFSFRAGVRYAESKFKEKRS
jgi:hypothetical protein